MAPSVNFRSTSYVNNTQLCYMLVMRNEPNELQFYYFSTMMIPTSANKGFKLMVRKVTRLRSRESKVVDTQLSRNYHSIGLRVA